VDGGRSNLAELAVVVSDRDLHYPPFGLCLSGTWAAVKKIFRDAACLDDPGQHGRSDAAMSRMCSDSRKAAHGAA